MKNFCNYTVTGDSGEAVILVHGSLSTKAQWDSLVDFLSTDYRVITYNVIGYGGTPFPEDPADYSLKEESDLINAVIDDVLEPDELYHIVGHSYGGVIALYHTFYNSRRIKSFTGYEPMSFHLLDKSNELISLASMLIETIKSDIDRGNPMDGVEKFINLWSAPGTFEVLPEAEKNTMAEGIKKMVLDFREAAGTPLSTKDYSKIETSACLIGGTRSPEYSTDIVKLLSSTLKNNQLHWVKSGHFGPLSHGDLVNPIIGDFLNQSSDIA